MNEKHDIKSVSFSCEDLLNNYVRARRAIGLVIDNLSEEMPQKSGSYKDAAFVERFPMFYDTIVLAFNSMLEIEKELENIKDTVCEIAKANN